MTPPAVIFEIRAHDDSGEWWAVDYQPYPNAALLAMSRLPGLVPMLSGWKIVTVKVKPVWN